MTVFPLADSLPALCHPAHWLQLSSWTPTSPQGPHFPARVVCSSLGGRCSLQPPIPVSRGNPPESLCCSHGPLGQGNGSTVSSSLRGEPSAPPDARTLMEPPEPLTPVLSHHQGPLCHRGRLAQGHGKATLGRFTPSPHFLGKGAKGRGMKRCVQD